MIPKVTIIVPVSRSDYLHELFHSLEILDCDSSNTNLLVIVNGNNELFVDARNRTELSKFSERLCVKFPNGDKVSNFNVNDRRKRIADIHNFAKQNIGKCDFVFGVEDDTIVPSNTLKKLLEDYSYYPHAGFIEGVELGRWGVYYVGAWKADNVYEPVLIESMLPPDDSNSRLEEIDAGGFYCFLSRSENYLNHTFDTFQGNSLGPDVNYGMKLREEGYQNYIDWTIRCVHRRDEKRISLSTNSPQKVIFSREKNNWNMRIA